MENRVAVLAVIIVAILAAVMTAAAQLASLETVETTDENAVTTITKTMTETLSGFSTTTLTSSVTSTTTLIITNTVTTNSTLTVTTTVTQTPVEAPSINLLSIQEGKAASWSKGHLRILVKPEDARRIDPDLQVVDAVGSAVDQWRRSIAEFTEGNPEYAYLRSLVLTVYVQGENDTLLQGTPDIDITFTESLASRLIGETKMLITSLHFISYADVTITVRDLSARGFRNVLTHELGHALGLNHSEREDDLMYSERDRGEIGEEVLCPSTLNLYALAIIYQWIETEIYSPYNATSVTLPENTEYKVLACDPP